MELPAQIAPELAKPEDSEVDEAVEVLLKAEAIKRNAPLFAAAKEKMLAHKQSIDAIHSPIDGIAALKAAKAALNPVA